MSLLGQAARYCLQEITGPLLDRLEKGACQIHVGEQSDLRMPDMLIGWLRTATSLAKIRCVLAGKGSRRYSPSAEDIPAAFVRWRSSSGITLPTHIRAPSPPFDSMRKRHSPSPVSSVFTV